MLNYFRSKSDIIVKLVPPTIKFSNFCPSLHNCIEWHTSGGQCIWIASFFNRSVATKKDINCERGNVRTLQSSPITQVTQWVGRSYQRSITGWKRKSLKTAYGRVCSARQRRRQWIEAGSKPTDHLFTNIPAAPGLNACQARCTLMHTLCVRRFNISRCSIHAAKRLSDSSVSTGPRNIDISNGFFSTVVFSYYVVRKIDGDSDEAILYKKENDDIIYF